MANSGPPSTLCSWRDCTTPRVPAAPQYVREDHAHPLILAKLVVVLTVETNFLRVWEGGLEKNAAYRHNVLAAKMLATMTRLYY